MTKSCCLVLCYTLVIAVPRAEAKGPAYTDPEKADADFALQGEYTGKLQIDSREQKFGVQVVALGKGKFLAVRHDGGLPGDGWDRGERPSLEAVARDGEVIFRSEDATATLRDGVLRVVTSDGRNLGELRRVVRKSPTLGKKPPKDAVVLFHGENADHWLKGEVSEGGLLMPGTTSKRKFGDHMLHLEFLLPYQPEDRGQGRGNSGVYLQGRYEVQMLDSFGLEGKHNECGGLYSIKDPDINMCLPPLAWQTYDIDYTAAKYDAGGKLVAKPRISVRHNGALVHDDVELPGDRSTTAAPVKPGPSKGPIHLQNHGNPVRYRNIWVSEK